MARNLDQLVAHLSDESLSQDQIRQELLDFLWHYESRFWFPQDSAEKQLLEIKHKLNAVEQKLGAARCRASEPAQAGAFAYLVTGVGGDDGREDLESWLRNCTLLEIADPYFFSPGAYRSTPEVLIEKFIELVPPSLRRVVIFHKPRPAKTLLDGFSEAMRARDIKVQLFRTEVLHDRVWIKDGNSAKVVGTSFNGLGNKLAFILNLPDNDRLAFQEQLTAIRKRQRSA